MGGKQLNRNWVEVRILNRLNDRGHAVSLYDLRDIIEGKRETIVNTLFSLRDEGLVNIFEIADGAKMVDITNTGKGILRGVLAAGRHR